MLLQVQAVQPDLHLIGIRSKFRQPALGRKMLKKAEDLSTDPEFTREARVLLGEELEAPN